MRNIILSLLFILSTVGVSAQTKQSAKTGAVKGSVTNKNTLQPIDNALVTIVNDTLRCFTDKNGEFRIDHVPTGYNTLYIWADGFHAVISESFLVTLSQPITVNIELSEMLVSVSEVVVSSSALIATTESPVSMRRIGTEEIEMTPGANRDVSKVVQSAPGVVPTSVERNDILVRGGGANENKYYLDGIEIPVLNHFAVQGGSGGNASLVNTDLLKSVNFYTGAFPANFGNGLSSVMDMRLKNGNSESLKAKITLGASDVGASVDTPISKNGKTTLLASYRRSYLQMLFSVLGLPFLPTYNDYQFKVSSQLSERDQIYFMGLGSIDNNRLNSKIKDPDDDQKYILGYLPENKQSSYVFGAGYRHSFEGGQLRLILSRNSFSNLLYKYEDNDSDKSKILNYDTDQSDNRLRAEVELWSLGGFKFTAGVGGGNSDYRNTTFRSTFVDNATVNEDFASKLSMWRYEIFATLSRRFFDERLSLLAGIRADGTSYSSKMSNPLNQISPRLSLAYNISPKWGINASVARYYQEPPYTTMGYKDSEGMLINKSNGLSYVASNHYIAGIEFNPNQKSRLSVEGFYKGYSAYPVSLIDSLPLSTGNRADYTIGDTPVKSIGKGRAFGGEFSYRNVDFNGTVINFSYTFLYSQFNRLSSDLEPIKGSYMASDWDMRHIINVSAIHKFKRNWTAGAKWYLTGGGPYSPYDFDISSSIAGWDARRRPYIDYALYNTERLKPYHQMDIRVDKVWYFSKWRLGFYVDIQNLYNFKSEGPAILMPQTDASGAPIRDPSRPGYYQMKSVKNDIGGTILPTLGITIEM